MDDTSEIDNQILEFLYYESATLTVNYAEKYIIKGQNITDNVKNEKRIKDRKKIDGINIVIKSYLDSQPINFNKELLWMGKLCSLISIVFNLSSHKEVSEKLINLFLDISQLHFKNLMKTDFWYELFLLIQIQV